LAFKFQIYFYLFPHRVCLFAAKKKEEKKKERRSKKEKKSEVRGFSCPQTNLHD
jgi:hypothetical protein